MLFNRDNAKAAFETAQKLKEHKDLYCLVSDRIPVSIVDLEYVVSDMFDLEIEVNDVDFPADFVRGMVERYDDGKCRISIRRDQSKDWKRFVAAKELCQLAIGTEADWYPDGTRTLETMVFAGAIGNGEHESSDIVDAAVQSEYLAEFVAYEVLYPYEFRATDRKLLEDGTQTIKTLANHYDIPSFIVSMALSDRYEQFRTRCLGLG